MMMRIIEMFNKHHGRAHTWCGGGDEDDGDGDGDDDHDDNDDCDNDDYDNDDDDDDEFLTRQGRPNRRGRQRQMLGSRLCTGRPGSAAPFFRGGWG